MKKLGKKYNYGRESIEAYSCASCYCSCSCSCTCSDSYAYFGNSTNITSSHGAAAANNNTYQNISCPG
jgi:putative bacteriocin precursor